MREAGIGEPGRWEGSSFHPLMRLLLLSLLVAVAGCTSSRPAEGGTDATLTGTVTYLQRIALPPDAVVTVRLLDVSLADAPSVTLAEQTIPTEGRNVPIAYALTYDPGRIEPRHRYAVRAEIRDGAGALRWTTDTTVPVLTQGAPSDDVEIRVVQVGETGAASGTDGLVGPTWRLVEITAPDGAALRPQADEALTITFAPDGRYSGQADCNRIGGAYTVDATGALDLSQGATTLAACAPPSSGDAFVQALAQVERAAVADGRLALRGPGLALVFERADLGMAPQPTGPDARLRLRPSVHVPDPHRARAKSRCGCQSGSATGTSCSARSAPPAERGTRAATSRSGPRATRRCSRSTASRSPAAAFRADGAAGPRR